MLLINNKSKHTLGGFTNSQLQPNWLKWPGTKLTVTSKRMKFNQGYNKTVPLPPRPLLNYLGCFQLCPKVFSMSGQVTPAILTSIGRRWGWREPVDCGALIWKRVLEISVWGAFFVYLRVNIFNSQGKSLKCPSELGRTHEVSVTCPWYYLLIYTYVSVSVAALHN